MTQPGKELAIKRLEDSLDQLSPLKEFEYDNAQFKGWRRDTRIAVEYVFGKDSKEVEEFESISFRSSVLSPEAMQAGYLRGLLSAEATLQSMIRQVQTYWADEMPQVRKAQPNQRNANSREVFIVHGRDDGARETVSRFVEKIGLKPVVLAEKPSKGRTIIEKFEAHADVGYVIVLMTADDRGALEGEEPRPRARQNVIFELGFFVGRLGREHVCALTQGDPEIPSDYEGVVYIPMNGDSRQMPLMRELKAAGLDVDANKALD